MALRDPRPTKFKIEWHREPSETPGITRWYATMGGIRVAEAVCTGRPGIDNYPWDWGLTDAGQGLAHSNRGRTSGVSDTLRDVKERVFQLFVPKLP